MMMVIGFNVPPVTVCMYEHFNHHFQHPLIYILDSFSNKSRCFIPFKYYLRSSRLGYLKIVSKKVGKSREFHFQILVDTLKLFS